MAATGAQSFDCGDASVILIEFHSGSGRLVASPSGKLSLAVVSRDGGARIRHDHRWFKDPGMQCACALEVVEIEVAGLYRVPPAVVDMVDQIQPSAVRMARQNNLDVA